MSTLTEREMNETYDEIRAEVLQWNWQGAEDAFVAFTDRHTDMIPTWFVDELLFAGMQLWAADRQSDVLRHFAHFFERAVGEERFWNPDDGNALAVLAD